MKIKWLGFFSLVFSISVAADDSTLKAAIGGGVGGAVGAALGNEVNGREGAVVGGALGGAVGAAVATDDKSQGKHGRTRHHYDYDRHYGTHPTSRFCPPGQAKKGRC